jgi:polyhydroxyalkanoate synthesis repressor PhaR
MADGYSQPPPDARPETRSDNRMVIIKKYANRRLYNTATSAYVTLEHLAAMVREGIEFGVFDAKTGEDITRTILTQIIFEAESAGHNLLPVNFLRDIIRTYGDATQGFLPSYLDLAMKSFRDSREHFAKTLTGKTLTGKSIAGGFDISSPVDLFQQAVKTNMAIMAEAARLFSVKSPSTPGSPPKTGPKPARKAEATADDLAQMREQMAALQARLDKIDGAGG